MFIVFISVSLRNNKMKLVGLSKMRDHSYFNWGHFFKILQLVGLAPFQQLNDNSRYVVSTKLRVHGFIISVITSHNLYFSYNIVPQYTEDLDLFSICFALLDILGFTVMNVIVLMITIFKAPALCILTNKINNLNRNCDQSCTRKPNTFRIFLIYSYYVIQNILCSSYYFTYVFHYDYELDFYFFFNCLTTMVLNQIFVGFDINFSIFANNAEIIFLKMNECLRQEEKLNKKNFIKKLITLNFKAHDIVNMINEYFSEMLLGFLILEFGSLVFVFFSVNKYEDSYNWVISTYWFLIYFSKLLFQVVTGSSVKKEVT